MENWIGKIIEFSATIAVSATVAQIAAADTVYSQDTIVIGNSCIGVDCYGSLSVSAPEMTLRENNTRVALTDGANLMRMTANSNVNGGGSYFAIDIPVSEEFSGASVSVNPTVLLATVLEDGRAQVELSPTFANLQVSGTAGMVDENRIFNAPQEQYYYLPSGSFTALTGTLISVPASTQIQDSNGSAVLASGVNTGYASVFSLSADGASVALGAEAEAVSGSVSVGASGVENVITHVADGTDSHDMITVGQLDVLTTLSDQQAVAVDELSNRAIEMSAISAALSALQVNPRNSSSFSLSAGFGYFESETAAALGITYLAGPAVMRLALIDSSQSSPQISVEGSLRW